MSRARQPLVRAAERRGVALAAAVGGVVIMGVLIAGVYFTSSQEYRVGNNVLVEEQAFRAAEFGLNTALASWDPTAMALLPPGGTHRLVYDSSAAGWVDTVVITRLNATGYQFVSTATAWGSFGARARRATALNVRLSIVELEESKDITVHGALTARGVTGLGGNPTLSGIDEHPAGWTGCPPLTTSIGGLAATSPTLLSLSGAASLTGLPPLVVDPAVADTTHYFSLADETWTSLTSIAHTVITGSPSRSLAPTVKADGKCNTSDPWNWGAPESQGHPCRNYFPIIHATGATNTLTLTGGAGQGILLVEGDLRFTGGVHFYGPIIVRGGLTTTGTNRVRGVALVANIPVGSSNDLKGTSYFAYSNCALHTAAKYAIAPRRIADRAWTEVY